MFNHEELIPLEKQRATLEQLLKKTDNHIFRIVNIFLHGKKILETKIGLLAKHLDKNIDKLTKLSYLEQFFCYELQRLQAELEKLSHLSPLDFTADEQHFENFALLAVNLEELWLIQICVDNGVRLDNHEVFRYYHDIALSYGNSQHAAMFKQLTTISIRDRCIAICDPNTDPSLKLDHLKKLTSHSDDDFELYDKMFNFIDLNKNYGGQEQEKQEAKRSIVVKRLELKTPPRLETHVSAFEYFIKNNPYDLVVLRSLSQKYYKLGTHPVDENKDNIFHIILKNEQLNEDTAYNILETILAVDADKTMTRALVEKDALGKNSLCVLEEKPTYWEKVTKLLHDKIVQDPIHDYKLLFDVFSNMLNDNTISRLYLSNKHTELARAIRDREELRGKAQSTYKLSTEEFRHIWSQNEYVMVTISGKILLNNILENNNELLANDNYFKQATRIYPLGRTYIWQGYNLENIKEYVAKYSLESKFDDKVLLDSALKQDDPDFSLLKYAISMSKYNKNNKGLKNIVSEQYGETLLFKAVMSQQPKKVIWLIKEIGCDPSLVYQNKENLLIQILARVNDKFMPNDMGAQLIHACLDHVDQATQKKIINHITHGTPTVLEWIEMCKHLKQNDDLKLKKDDSLEKLAKYLIKAGADQNPSNTTVTHTYNARTRKTKTIIYSAPPAKLEDPDDPEVILRQFGCTRLNPS